MRFAFFSAIFIAALVSATLHSSKTPDKPIALCPKGQHAVLVGFGKDVQGEYLATYECSK